MAKVFISYRRSDSAGISGRIYDRLVDKFRQTNVFKDVYDIPAGEDFGAYIQDSLRQCKVLLVIIGPSWLEIRNAKGERRIDDTNDWVRIEIETALTLGLTIIPLLVEGSTMPSKEDFPPTLEKVAHLNGLQVRNDPDFANDMGRVIAVVARIIEETNPPTTAPIAEPVPSGESPALNAAKPALNHPIATDSMWETIWDNIAPWFLFGGLILGVGLIIVVFVANAGKLQFGLPTTQTPDARFSHSAEYVDIATRVANDPFPTIQPCITFDADASDANPLMPPNTYTWDFGESGSPSDVGHGIHVNHCYQSSGTYTVTLTVHDPSGRAGTTQQTINIQLPAQTPTVNREDIRNFA